MLAPTMGCDVPDVLFVSSKLGRFWKIPRFETGMTL